MKIVGLETRKLPVKRDVRFVHGHHFEGFRVEENERIVKMCETLGVDLLWCDLVTQSLTGVPSLASTILAETDPQIRDEDNKHCIPGNSLFFGFWWFPSLSRIQEAP